MKIYPTSYIHVRTQGHDLVSRQYWFFLAFDLASDLVFKSQFRIPRTPKTHVLQPTRNHNGPPQLTHTNLLLPLAYWSCGGGEDLTEPSIHAAYSSVHEFSHEFEKLGHLVWLDTVDLGKDDLEGNSMAAKLSQEEDIILFEAVLCVYEEEGTTEPTLSALASAQNSE